MHRRRNISPMPLAPAPQTKPYRLGALRGWQRKAILKPQHVVVGARKAKKLGRTQQPPRISATSGSEL